MTFWRDRRVLVTGCAGFLGRWLRGVLRERDAVVTGITQHEDGSGRDVVRGDVRDIDLVQRVLADHRIDTVFHLAATSSTGAARDDPLGTFDVNVRGTWAVLEACRHQPTVTRIVVASTGRLYGDATGEPRTESDPIDCRFPYETSKACADMIARSYAHTYGLPVAVTRCGNLFGPGDTNMSRIVPGTIHAALCGERPQIRSNGKPVRDFLFVADAVEGHLALAEHIDDAHVRGRAYNLGSGNQLTVLELTRIVLEAAGRPDLEPVVLGTSAAEPVQLRLDCRAAARDLGWEPGAPLASRIAETVDWYRTRLVPEHEREPGVAR